MSKVSAPKYLGACPITNKQHIKNVKNKMKTRNNIISKLAGTTWECHANVLKTSALALVV